MTIQHIAPFNEQKTLAKKKKKRRRRRRRKRSGNHTTTIPHKLHREILKINSDET